MGYKSISCEKKIGKMRGNIISIDLLVVEMQTKLLGKY